MAPEPEVAEAEVTEEPEVVDVPPVVEVEPPVEVLCEVDPEPELRPRALGVSEMKAPRSARVSFSGATVTYPRTAAYHIEPRIVARKGPR